MEAKKKTATDYALEDEERGRKRIFFRTRNDKDAEKIKAFLTGAPSTEIRLVLQAMIKAAMCGCTCTLGKRIKAYPNKWHNGVYIELEQN